MEIVFTKARDDAWKEMLSSANLEADLQVYLDKIADNHIEQNLNNEWASKSTSEKQDMLSN